MKYKSNLKRIWSVVAAVSLSLLVFRWVGYDSQNLQYANLALNSAMFLLSLPCGFFAVPVVLASAYYLEMSPFGADGIFLSTVLILLLGSLQWFWIANFWLPTEPNLQTLDLAGVK